MALRPSSFMEQVVTVQKLEVLARVAHVGWRRAP